MKDLFHSLLIYLNSFPLDYIPRAINDYLISVGYKKNSLEDARVVKAVINVLQNRKYVECHTVLFEELFAETPYIYNPTTGKHDIPENRTLENVVLDVSLTSIGKLYIESWQREVKQHDFLEQQTNSIRITNRFSMVSTGISLLLSIIVISIQVLTCNRDAITNQRQVRKEATDSLSQWQIQENVVELRNILHQISLSLKDTVKVKVKIEK